MEKTYKRSLVTAFLNLIVMVIGVFVLFLILEYFAGAKIACIIAVLAAVGVVFTIISNCKVKVVVKENELIIYEGKKKFCYNLENVGIGAETVNNSSLTLYVNTAEGERKSFDLSFLGIGKFQELIEDLGVVGEKSSITKLHDSNFDE